MSALPRPLTPPECDLRGFEWMQLWGHRMFTSSWYRAARKDGRGGIASLKLYWSAMLQQPAGSLPNDEEELCMLADFGEDMRAWRRHRPVAMHGFVLCDDNRWYHPVVAEQVLEAYDRRLKSERSREVDRERLKRWRASRNGAAHPPDKPNGNGAETRFETPNETPPEHHYRFPETRFDTRSETSRAFDKTVQDKTTPPVAPPVPGGAARRVSKPRNPFHDMAREMDAAEAERAATINGTAEDVANFSRYRQRLIGGSYG